MLIYGLAYFWREAPCRCWDFTPHIAPTWQVWPGTLKRITAVEPSQAMRDLGERLEAARRFAHPSAPLVRIAGP
jgi:hypothetical protein